MNNKELIKMAVEQKEKSYSPYSKFKVGSALECEDGTIYTGCNIENSAYSPTCCAERVAIFKAVSDGKTNFKKIAIVSDGEKYIYPCGVCRQVLSEFCDDIEIILALNNGEYTTTKLKDLLPNSFNLDD